MKNLPSYFKDNQEKEMCTCFSLLKTKFMRNKGSVFFLKENHKRR